jgi:hypothetical protein
MSLLLLLSLLSHGATWDWPGCPEVIPPTTRPAPTPTTHVFADGHGQTFVFGPILFHDERLPEPVWLDYSQLRKDILQQVHMRVREIKRGIPIDEGAHQWVEQLEQCHRDVYYTFGHTYHALNHEQRLQAALILTLNNYGILNGCRHVSRVGNHHQCRVLFLKEALDSLPRRIEHRLPPELHEVAKLGQILTDSHNETGELEHWLATTDSKRFPDAVWLLIAEAAHNGQWARARAYLDEFPDESQRYQPDYQSSSALEASSRRSLEQFARGSFGIDKEGVELGSNSRHVVAEALFRTIEEKFEEIVAHRPMGDEGEIHRIKGEQISEFWAMADALVSRFDSYEWSTGAIYLQGMVVLHWVDLGVESGPDDGPFFEMEDVGVSHLVNLIALSRANKHHSPWVTKAYQALQERRPRHVTPFKQEVSGETPGASSPVPLTPRQVADPNNQ